MSRDFLSLPTIALLTCWAMSTLPVRAEPVPSFALEDLSPRSARYGQMVSPQDYRLQISAYYFGSAGWSYCRAQFAYLEDLLAEIQSENPALNVEIIGINRSDQSGNNALVTGSRSLPWLQDSDLTELWRSWGVVWRDVRIVNSQQELASVYNLTNNNLGLPLNRFALKEMLLQEAQVQDEDEDGLRDDWEALYLEDLAATSGADDDPDGDGHSNFAEYAFGSNPRLATSVPETFTWTRQDPNGQTQPGLVMKRRAGDTVAYDCLQSEDLATWETASSKVQWVNLERVYDGTGTFLAYAANVANTDNKQSFLRVEAKQQ